MNSGFRYALETDKSPTYPTRYVDISRVEADVGEDPYDAGSAADFLFSRSSMLVE